MTDKKTILLIEDEAIIGMQQSQELRGRGYDVIHELHGKKAVQTFQAKRHEIDLVLMDIDLGSDIDGTIAAERILELEDIPVVFLSSHTETDIVEKTEKITSYGYVVKNSGITVLDASIKMAFKLHASRRSEKQREETLRLQRDLGLKLSSTNSLERILRYCLDYAIKIGGMDCGGVYLVRENGDIDMVHHKGLPGAFLAKTSHYQADSPNAGIVMAGKPVYTHYDRLGVPMDKVRRKEGIKAICVIPVPFENKIIACLNLASHSRDEIPDYSKAAVENVSTQIGSSIIRAQIGDDLEKQKTFVDQALDSQNDTFFLFEIETGKALRWNRAFRDISGYSDEEIAALPAPSSYYGPDDLKRAERFIKEVLAAGTGKIDLELICKDGTKILTEYNVAVVRNEQGSPEYMISIGRDIRDHEKAASELRASELNLQSVTENLQDAIFVKNREREYTFVNPAAAVMMGRAVPEILGKRAEEIFSAEDFQKIKEIDDLNFKGENVQQTRELTINERKFYLHTAQNPIYNDQDEVCGIAGIVQDVTRQKNDEARIKQLLAEKELLLREVHHRVKNDMFIIRSIISLQSSASSSPEVAEALREAEDRVSLMFNIYNALYRGEDLQQINLKPYLLELISNLKKTYSIFSGIEISEKIDDRIIMASMAFPVGIMINELVTNAYKYAFDEEKKGKIGIRVRFKENYLHITVQDNGSGIDEKYLEDDYTTFGLQMIHSISQQYDGTFELQNKNGTIARIVLNFDETEL